MESHLTLKKASSKLHSFFRRIGTALRLPLLPRIPHRAMAHNAHPLSSLPLDPYQWHESVLSTRTLSYMSTTDALGSSGGHLPQYTWSRNPTRQSSMTDGSSYDLEMVVAQSRDTPANETVVLPESVADSLLFRLPPELREKVYAYCITAAGNAYVEWPAPVIVGAMGHGMCPELLRTCKAIRDEAGPMLYALNGMAFQHPSDANMFVRAMTSPAYSRCITKLRLHVRAQDTRLWMPYLTSSIDRSRSLKADFPSLRELHVRYISNKWNHALPPEQNMKLWEDAKFEEVINGLRQVFYPPKTEATKPLNEMTAHDFMAYVDRHRPGEDMAFKRQLLELHKAHAPPIPEADGPPPVVRVTCR